MMETIDETLLNDDNDDDLDYDLDPKEENALLQEEADNLGQEYEDVLDINVDYDQMDVTDDKLDTLSETSKNEAKDRRNSAPSEKHTIQFGNVDRLKKFKNYARLQRRGPLNKTVKSKTVLINPRFKGPVNVNGRPFPWENPIAPMDPMLTNHQYSQPWSSENSSSQTVHPVNNYNPALFVPNNSYPYVQHHQQILQIQHFAPPQAFMNSAPVVNQVPLVNIVPSQPTMQVNHCTNNYQVPTIPHVERIYQVPEAPKLPVHQRLGFPSNNFNAPPNKQNHYNNQSFHKQVPNQNFNQSNFNKQDQIVNMGHPHMNNSYHENNKLDNSRITNFQKKQHRKFVGSRKVNNRILLSPNKPICKTETENHTISTRSKQSENVQCITTDNRSNSNIVVVPEDEDEETRQYRMKIEEQKRKREEILKKKEENRLKSLSDMNVDISNPPVMQTKENVPDRNFKQKKFFHQYRSPQNLHFVKQQINSNNIVITGNDDQCHFNSYRSKNKMSTYNKGFNKSPSLRIVTAEPISSSNMNSNSERFDKEDHSKNLSSFLSNRVVSAQDNLMKTNIVVVKNLATATTKPKIMKLCGGIGSVQKLQMETNERQATIHFDSVASAHKFYNKYRRYMIDLSVIQVDLIPSDGST